MTETIRLFISIELPESLQAKLSQLARELPEGGIKAVEPENLHITLKFLGEVEAKKPAEIEQALRAVTCAHFSLSLKGVGVFPNENHVRVVWVGCESAELNVLAEKIHNALSPLFLKEKFSAHVTIARVKKKVDVRGFLQSHANENFGTFEVREFHLKRSELLRGGPVYRSQVIFPIQG